MEEKIVFVKVLRLVQRHQEEMPFLPELVAEISVKCEKISYPAISQRGVADSSIEGGAG